MQQHYFIAIPVSNDIRMLLKEWTFKVKANLKFKTWVHFQDYHITLVFLGNSTFQQLQTLKSSLDSVVSNHKEFTLSLNGIGTFGKQTSPRILWSGIIESELLLNLRTDIYNKCVELGYSLDKRPFSPHITLARKWIGENHFPVEYKNQLFQSKEEISVDWKVRHVVLYQTYIKRTPKYQPLKIWELSREK